MRGIKDQEQKNKQNGFRERTVKGVRMGMEWKGGQIAGFKKS